MCSIHGICCPLKLKGQQQTKDRQLNELFLKTLLEKIAREIFFCVQSKKKGKG